MIWLVYTMRNSENSEVEKCLSSVVTDCFGVQYQLKQFVRKDSYGSGTCSSSALYWNILIFFFALFFRKIGLISSSSAVSWAVTRALMKPVSLYVAIHSESLCRFSTASAISDDSLWSCLLTLWPRCYSCCTQQIWTLFLSRLYNFIGFFSFKISSQ